MYENSMNKVSACYKVVDNNVREIAKLCCHEGDFMLCYPISTSLYVVARMDLFLCIPRNKIEKNPT